MKPKESAFGFTKGMTLKQVQAVAKIEKVPNTRKTYVTRKPPAPVAYLRVYTVIVSPNVGLCLVRATTDDPPNFVGIANVDIEHIRNSLLAKYGPAGMSHLGRGLGITTSSEVWWRPLGPGTAIFLSVNTDEFGALAGIDDRSREPFDKLGADSSAGLSSLDFTRVPNPTQTVTVKYEFSNYAACRAEEMQGL
jgi:hypothetical protein